MASHDATIKALHDARTHAAEELRSLYAEAAGAELSAEQAEREARAAAEMKASDERIAALLEAREIDAAVAAVAAEAPKAEAAIVSDEDTFRSMVDAKGHWSHEFRADEQLVGTGPDSSVSNTGGNLVPQTFVAQLHEYMVETTGVVAAGAQVIRTASGEEMIFPVADGYPAASLVSENGSIGNSDATFAQVSIGAYKYGFMSQISSELLADSAVNITSFLARVGGRALGEATGQAFLTGTGSGQPQGVLAASGGFDTVASASGSVAAGFDLDDVNTLIYSVDRPYRAGAAFVTSENVVRDLRAIVDADGRSLWQPSITAGEPDTLGGYPVIVDSGMPTGQTNGTKGMIFGNMAEGVIVRYAGGVRIESSVDHAFANDLLSIRFLVRADSEIIDPNAAKVLTYTT